MKDKNDNNLCHFVEYDVEMTCDILLCDKTIFGGMIISKRMNRMINVRKRYTSVIFKKKKYCSCKGKTCYSCNCSKAGLKCHPKCSCVSKCFNSTRKKYVKRYQKDKKKRKRKSGRLLVKKSNLSKKDFEDILLDDDMKRPTKRKKISR